VDLRPIPADRRPFAFAWMSQLSEQTLINNIPKEILNMAGRVVGWSFLDLVFYGGRALFQG